MARLALVYGEKAWAIKKSQAMRLEVASWWESGSQRKRGSGTGK